MQRKRAKTERAPANSASTRERKALDRILAKLRAENGVATWAVLFAGPQQVVEEKALAFAHERNAEPLIVHPPGRAYAAARERLRAALEPDRQLKLGEKRSAPVVVLLGLDRFPGRMFFYLKGRLERPVVPWLCVATCETTERIPDWLASMFIPFGARKAFIRRKRNPKRR